MNPFESFQIALRVLLAALMYSLIDIKDVSNRGRVAWLRTMADM